MISDRYTKINGVSIFVICTCTSSTKTYYICRYSRIGIGACLRNKFLWVQVPLPVPLHKQVVLAPGRPIKNRRAIKTREGLGTTCLIWLCRIVEITLDCHFSNGSSILPRVARELIEFWFTSSAVKNLGTL